MKVSLSSLNTLLEQVEEKNDIILSADRGDFQDVMKGDPFDYEYSPEKDNFTVIGLNSKRERLSDKKVDRLEKAVGKSFDSSSKAYRALFKRMSKEKPSGAAKSPSDTDSDERKLSRHLAKSVNDRLRSLSSETDPGFLKAEAKRLISGTGAETAVKKLYLNALTSKAWFNDFKSESQKGFDSYKGDLSWKSTVMKVKIGIVLTLWFIVMAGAFVLSGGTTAKAMPAAAVWLFEILLTASDMIAVEEAESLLQSWDSDEFQDFGLALYPLFLLPEVKTRKDLRRQVAKLVGDDILQPFAYIPSPSLFSASGTGSYEKESDATLLYDEMDGFTSKGAWGLIDGASGEAIVADIIKRRSGKLGGKNNLHVLYDEFSKAVEKREGPRVPERRGNGIYYHDLIDWIEDETKGLWFIPQVGLSGDLQNFADMVKKALRDNKKERYSPGTIPGATSDDAATLYTAMAGEDVQLIPGWLEAWGTDEDAIDAVLDRRKSDIPELYAEFNTYLARKGEADDGDLIDWLKGEGETRSAQIVIKALKDEGMERYKPGERRKKSKRDSDNEAEGFLAATEDDLRDFLSTSGD